MISPELLRRYPFFAEQTDQQLRTIAMMADEISMEQGKTVFEEGEAAANFYLLIEGSIELYYRSQEEFYPKTRKEFHVGDINPGEIFAISALIEPHVLNATAKTALPCRAIKIDAVELRTAIDGDPQLGCRLMRQVAKTAKERLAATRVLLAAASAP
jgi:CRP-like cAMP-binding protein